jgi:hypothetical protein
MNSNPDQSISSVGESFFTCNTNSSSIGGKKANALYYELFRFAWPLALRGPFSAPRFTSSFIAIDPKLSL